MENLEQKTLEGYIGALPKTEYVVGLGGGTAVDAAKYVAMQTQTKLVTILPSVVWVKCVPLVEGCAQDRWDRQLRRGRARSRQ